MQSTAMRTSASGVGQKVRLGDLAYKRRQTSFLVKSVLEGFCNLQPLAPLPTPSGTRADVRRLCVYIAPNDTQRDWQQHIPLADVGVIGHIHAGKHSRLINDYTCTVN